VITLRDELQHHLDGEAVVFDGDDILVATERPEIFRFDRTGNLLGALAVPGDFRVSPLGRARLNQAFECLTMVDERTLIASMENALTNDRDDLMRFQSWERSVAGQDFRPAAQFAYRIEPGLLVSDIAATGDGRLLVLERGFDSSGNRVHLYLTDLRGAADVSAVGFLGPDTPALGKRLLADVMDLPSDGAAARQPQTNPLLGNIEAMAVTDQNTHGQIGLLLATDHNRTDISAYRPAHVHFLLDEPGYDKLVTHLFPAGTPYLDSDVVFGVKDALITPFTEHQPGLSPDGTVTDRPFLVAHYNFVLQPARS
jgi:hypothetical protein